MLEGVKRTFEGCKRTRESVQEQMTAGKVFWKASRNAAQLERIWGERLETIQGLRRIREGVQKQLKAAKEFVTA
jgi:seryl-tRNA synthetase